MPHSLALFSLLPLNLAATYAAEAYENVAFQSTLETGELVLDVGHVQPRHGGPNMLATLGRSPDSDILSRDRFISRFQGSFELNPRSKLALFRDQSPNKSSRIYGHQVPARVFHNKTPPMVVLLPKYETIIGMGGRGSDRLLFLVVWPAIPGSTEAALSRRAQSEADATPLPPAINDVVLSEPEELELMQRADEAGPELGGHGELSISQRSYKMPGTFPRDSFNSSSSSWRRSRFASARYRLFRYFCASAVDAVSSHSSSTDSLAIVHYRS